MEPILIPLHLSLFLHILTLLEAGVLSPPIYTPVDDITLDYGNLGQHSNNYDSRIWSGDINSTFSPIQDGESNMTSQSRKAPPSVSQFASQVPYTTARLSYSEFTYNIPLSPGKKFVRLHFNPASYPDFQSSNSLFSVTASDYILLKDFRAYNTADDATPLMREFCVNIETEHSLNITFTPSKDAYVFINGIEIVSMPTNLYTTSVRSIGSNSPYSVKSRKALDMVYRINVGGKAINTTEDTGVYRKWEAADDMYLDGLSKKYSVLAQNDTIELKFVETPEYSAPKEVYNTGRSMWMNKTVNYNLTWSFPVDSNFSYLVRLHFCEFESDVTKIGERVSVIYIANQTAEQGADIILWSGGNGIPTYRDYMLAMIDPGSQKKINLSISFQALHADLSSEYRDATLSGLEIFKLIDPKGELGSIPDLKMTQHGKSFPVLALVAGLVSSILVFFVVGYMVFRRRWKVEHSGSSNRIMKFKTTPGSSHPCRYFSLAEIKAATKNFSDALIIGAGGFGNVYKGCIDSGATAVAIKRLKPESSQGVHEFETEIEMLSELHHRHLVSLIGYCSDKGEMILVYDYMAHGTLRDHLYHTTNPPLPWEQRLQICIGAARGLQYLHSGVKGTIIHRDVKSTNILLDDKWVAKVSDFGLSKGTTTMSETHISTIVKGSFGYLDPEYYRRQRLTEKSDVYSFGVVLCEVLCARPAVIHTEKTEAHQVNLAEWAKSCHQNGALDQMIDPSLRGKIGAECLNIFADVAISCMHDDGTERPSMNDVVRGLELALELQPSAEENINCTEKIGETETSSSEQSCATNNSIICISATIFSEINNPIGR
ncbi:PREDICTED: receptor-like protein kinase FERONIA [Fragaria vesca subsp. vesca]|uniref:MRLK54 n=1 Tax=Fragaria ananassa TaxID=3747 RepID=A0A1J0F5W5_FRAAN|nr:PREDICTED: receptor-like protein kinase FERONIA [Fragaria vesca subsp. vesca]APC23827.1 MRLK54 [Fragaria x ananassa]